MTAVIGLDLSLQSTGIARIAWQGADVVTDIDRVQSRGSKTDTWEMRSKRIAMLVKEIAQKILPADLVVIEGPSFASTSTSSHDRSWFWGKVYDCIAAQRIVGIIVVPPSSVKKWATGKGNADKDDMMLAAARTWPDVEGIKNDTADALALAAIGVQFLNGPCEFRVTEYRRAVVDGMRAPAEVVA